MPGSQVYVDFVVRGVPDVGRAFKTVSDYIRTGESAGTKAQQRESQTRVKTATQEARDKIAAFKRENAERERGLKATAKASEQAAKAEQRSAERSAANMQRIRERSASMAGRFAAQEARAFERAEDAKTRATEKAEKAKQRIRERSATMAGQFAAKQARDEASAGARAGRDNFSRRREFASTVMGAGSRALSTVSGGIQQAATTVLGLGGGFSVADSVQRSSSLEKQAIYLANKAVLPGGKRASKADILSTVKATSVENGTDADQVLGAWNAYTDKTGDFEGGKKSLGFFTKLAKGTGADLEQVAKTAGILKVQNKDLDDGKLQQLLLNTVAAGRLGSVDMPELASHAGSITKTASAYAGTQAENQQKLLGLSQIGVRTGSISEAATMLSNISGDASKHNKAISSLLGADTFNAKGQIAAGPDKFIADVLEKTGGNRTKIQALGFGQRSLKMFDALLPTYNSKESEILASGGSAADARKGAKAAVLADMGQFTGATMTKESLDKDFAEVMKSSAEQFDGAVRQLRTAVGEQLLPVFLRLVPILEEGIPYLKQMLDGVAKIAQWAESNPLASLGGAIIALMTKEILAAQIGATIKSLITGGAPGGGGGLPVPGGGGGGSPNPVSGVALTTAAAVQMGAYADLYTSTTGAMDEGKRQGSQLGADLGSNDPSKKAAAQRMLGQAKLEGNSENTALAWGDRVSKAAEYATGPMGLAASFVSSKALGAMGIETGGQRAEKALKAHEVVDQAELHRVTTATFSKAITDAAAKAGNANDPARSQPISKRAAQ
jgi:hypothetical protein